MIIRPIYFYAPSDKPYQPCDYGNGAGVALAEMDPNVHLQSYVKNGCRLVLKSDPPNKEGRGETEFHLASPNTPRELCNLLSGLGKLRFGKAVDQLQDAGYANYGLCQSLYPRLTKLAQEFGKFHRELLGILENKPDQEGAVEVLKK